jgi:hypothetical protein
MAVPAKVEDLVDALDVQDDQTASYFSRETGEVYVISDEALQIALPARRWPTGIALRPLETEGHMGSYIDEGRMLIRPATEEDHDAIWQILEPTIRAGETYALPRDMSKEYALAYWTGPDRQTFVADQNGQTVGTYYLRANQLGGGAHVANCG